jgi:IclR family transcriptional regulator, KDG regulon repressor
MPRAKVQSGPIYFSQVLDRVMKILNCFTSVEPEIRFSKLADRLQLHKSTLYRLLEALRSYGLVEVDSTTGKYHLGLKLFELGALATGRLEITKSGGPVLEDLARQTGETAHMCILDGPDVVYVAKVEGTHRFYVPTTIGRRNPAYCTGVGKAILAHLPEGDLEAYLAEMSLKKVRSYTQNTITSPIQLRERLKLIRARGYSVDDEEISEGLRCIGAPVWDYSNKVVAGVSIAGPSVRVTRRKVPELARHVVDAAGRISKRLGFRTATLEESTARAR